MRVVMMFVCFLYVANLQAQTNAGFRPFPDDSATLYQFDLHKNYFADDQQELTERLQLIKGFENLEKKFKSLPGEKGIYRLMLEYDSLLKKVGKHSAYLGMFVYIDLSNPIRQMKLDTLSQQLTPVINRIGDKIRSVPSSSIARNVTTDPPGPDYRFFHSQLQTDPLRRFSESERRIINDLTPGLTNWQPRLFQTTLRTTEFKPVKTPNGMLYLLANLNEIFNHPVRSVRKEGYLNNLEGLMSRREIYAMALLESVRNRNRVAAVSGFKDFPEQSYSQRLLTRDMVNKLLKVLADSAYINKRYETLLFQDIKKLGGIDTVYAWDRQTPDPKAPTPRYTITEATNIILEATKFLGNDYYIEMSKLLDPRNGRLDMVNRPNRVQRPGFSTGSVGYNSVFYQGNYEGFMSDLIIFGHEAGHAVQNMLMDKNRVSSFYALGPGYFTESFAGFNELLITDYLYQKAGTKEYKIYYLSRFLEQATELFRTAMDATYEQILYDSIPAGKISNADQLEAQMQETGYQFSQWFQPYMKYEMQWVNKMQFTTNPLYRLNYVYSKLLAVYYFSLFQQDRNRLVQNYNALLRNGYDQAPDTILKNFLDISLTDKKLFDVSLGLIKRKIDEYEALTK
jgi:oligoendopeptidase F